MQPSESARRQSDRDSMGLTDRMSPGYHDLPEGRVSFEDPMRVGQLSHRIGPLQNRAERGTPLHFRVEERQNSGGELAHQRNALLQPPGSHHRADNLQP